MLVALVLAESLLFELTQRDLRWQNLNINPEELVALLNDSLDDFVVVQSHEEVKPTVSSICEHDSALNVLNSCNEDELIDSTGSGTKCRNTFYITYDPVNIFVVVAGEDGVCRGVKLIQGTRSDLECHWKLDA